MRGILWAGYAASDGRVTARRHIPRMVMDGEPLTYWFTDSPIQWSDFFTIWEILAPLLDLPLRHFLVFLFLAALPVLCQAPIDHMANKRFHP